MMNDQAIALTSLPNPRYRIGLMAEDRYWLERPDGRIFQVDADTRAILTRLAQGDSITVIAGDYDIPQEELHDLFILLGAEAGSSFELIDETVQETSRKNEKSVSFFCPWIEQTWFTWAFIACAVSSIAACILFAQQHTMQFLSGALDQWLVAAILTVSVLIHELGHLLAMPRHRSLSISIQWAGPLPMLNIISNEAWKLNKRQRLRIDLAGVSADILVCGITGLVGLLAPQAAPWVWTFLFVHMFRMVFAIIPLLPGDGYWVLVDLFEQPNLWGNALKKFGQRKIHWLSCYVILRYAFLALIWILYGYIVYMWSTVIFAQSWSDALMLLLHPAPLLISLNLLMLIYKKVLSWTLLG